MPPKKKEEKKVRVVLGRPGNNLKSGIVGLPNIGKSSLFNALTLMSVPAENFPFCTIDPTEARVPVPDERFDYLCSQWKPKSEVPAVLAIFDIAGLVRGASEGQGLGNEFLSHIGATDLLFHVVRAFAGKAIAHVEGDVDPIRDLKIISDELVAKDLQIVNTKVSDAQKTVKRGTSLDKAMIPVLATLEKVQAWLQEGKDVRDGDWKVDDIPVINPLCLLTAKPVVYLVNISDKDFEKQGNKWLKPIKDWVEDRSPGAPIIPFSASWEKKFIDATPEERKEMLENGGKPVKSMIPKIIRTGYSHLGLINYFTTGEDEVRAWTIQKGLLAPKAAGVIHGDFEKTFIQAEQYSYADFKELGTEAEVKSAGRLKTRGKTYEVEDGDILFFKTGAGGGKKK